MPNVIVTLRADDCDIFRIRRKTR